jgi:arylsulfatase A-like enzyme
MKTLEDRRLIDDVFVIFWSDHGEMLGDHNRLFKCTFHESSIRVPLILRWPGKIAEGMRSDSAVEIIDVLPTVLEVIGIEPPGNCFGTSLWPVLKNQSKSCREETLSEIFYWREEGARRTMIRTRQYKYAIDEKLRGFMLYNLGDDPFEQDNLIGKRGTESLEEELKERLLARIFATQYVTEGDVSYSMQFQA